MGAAAYNRGNQIIVREADERMAEAQTRAERQALKDEAARLRERVAALERDLARGRRCIAAERRGREQLRLRLAAAERAYDFAVPLLCRLAFPADDRSRAPREP